MLPWYKINQFSRLESISLKRASVIIRASLKEIINGHSYARNRPPGNKEDTGNFDLESNRQGQGNHGTTEPRAGGIAGGCGWRRLLGLLLLDVLRERFGTNGQSF